MTIGHLSVSLKKTGKEELNLLFLMTLVTTAALIKPRYETFCESACRDFQKLLSENSFYTRIIEEHKRRLEYESFLKDYPQYMHMLMTDHYNDDFGRLALKRDILGTMVGMYIDHLKNLNCINELMRDVTCEGDRMWCISTALSTIRSIDPIASTLLLNIAAVNMETGHYLEAAFTTITSTMISTSINTKPSAKAFYHLICALTTCCMFDESLIISQIAIDFHPEETSLREQYQEVVTAKDNQENQYAENKVLKPDKRKKLKKISRK
jgi:hypothetical protein